MKEILKVIIVALLIFEYCCPQTNRQTDKQTNKQTNQRYQKHNLLCQGDNEPDFCYDITVDVTVVFTVALT